MAPKFHEFVDRFLAWSKQQHRPKPRDLDGTNCNTLLRFFRGSWLDEITQGKVEDFKFARIGEATRNAKDGSTVSNASVNRALTTLKLLFHYAQKSGYAVTNPAKASHIFRREAGECAW